MPADDLPIEPDRLPDAPHEKTPIARREQRETERLITDWERETRQLGHALALMTLDVSAMTGPRWAHRFLIAVNPVIEHSSFLFYGARIIIALGIAGDAKSFHPDSRPAADAIHPSVHERLYYLDALQLSRPDARRS